MIADLLINIVAAVLGKHLYGIMCYMCAQVGGGGGGGEGEGEGGGGGEGEGGGGQFAEADGP